MPKITIHNHPEGMGLLGLDCGDFFMFPDKDTVYMVVRHHYDDYAAVESTEYTSLTDREHHLQPASSRRLVVPLVMDSAEFSVRKQQ